LIGDVNASIHRSKLNSRDNDFQKFLMELNLKIPTMCPVQSTVYHFNNRDESQIDYFCRKCGNGGKIHNISEGVFKHLKSRSDNDSVY
jgi:hypothetical protein